MKIFSVDAETNGLYGEPFAIGVTVRVDGHEIARFVGRCPIGGSLDPWVEQNILPALTGLEENRSDLPSLLEGFWAFWMAHKDGAICLAHIGSPVESGLFRRCVAADSTNRMFAGPYPLHEVGTALLMAGEDPSSVDGYNKRHGLSVPFEGATHHPLFDAISASVAFEHAMARIRA